MKHTLALICLLFITLAGHAQNSKTFQGVLYNKEYDVTLKINIYDNDITIPGQEIFGPLPGYLKYSRDSRCWIITSAEETAEDSKVLLEMINDYGSEDLTATITFDKASKTYTLHQGEGATIKIAKNGKWVKLPKHLTFTMKEAQ